MFLQLSNFLLFSALAGLGAQRTPDRGIVISPVYIPVCSSGWLFSWDAQCLLHCTQSCSAFIGLWMPERKWKCWLLGCVWLFATPCPRDSPGKNTGVGWHSLLQAIFLTQESNPGLRHSRQILYQSELPRKSQMLMSCLKTLVINYLLSLSLKFFIFPKLLFKGTRLIFPWPVIIPPQVRGWIWEIVWAALAVLKTF